MYDFRGRGIIRLGCGKSKILRSIDDVDERLEKLLLMGFSSDSLLRHLPSEFELWGFHEDTRALRTVRQRWTQ